MKKKVLLLDIHNRPINICTWRRALILIMKGKAENARRLNDIESMIRVENVLIPSVIKLTYDLAVQYKELPNHHFIVSHFLFYLSNNKLNYI